MDVNELYRRLLQPSPALVADIARLDGDILILRVGVKMGPALARLAKERIDHAGVKKNVIDRVLAITGKTMGVC